jgi:hypothetical protein
MMGKSVLMVLMNFGKVYDKNPDLEAIFLVSNSCLSSLSTSFYRPRKKEG